MESWESADLNLAVIEKEKINALQHWEEGNGEKPVELGCFAASNAVAGNTKTNFAVKLTRNVEIDDVLLSCLQDNRQRMMLLKLEDEIISFLKNPACQRTKLEPLPSYHRLVAHRIAERCLLARESSELFEYSMDGVSVAVRVIELIKTPETLIPSNLLIDHVENARKQSEEDGLSKVVKKMITRKDCHLGDSKRSKRRDQVKKDKVVKTMEDREIAYQKVRARIFGTEDRSKTPVEEVVQNVETGMSKVTLVNREEEMNDPDFVRRSDLGIGHNSLNGNANRVDGQQKNYASEDYDASQQGYPYRTNYNAGYAGGATEPRGRFQNSSSGRSDYSRNDYNRSDYNRKDYGRDDYSRNVHSNSSGTSLQVGNEQRRYYNDDRGGASSGTPPHRAHGGASMQRGPPPPSYQGQSNRRGRNSMPRQRPGSHLDQRPSKSYNKDFPPLG